MAIGAQKTPVWFWIVTAVLLLWNLVGVVACIQQFRLGAEAMGPATSYDRALFASLPPWYNWVFAVAEAAGVGGVVALFARSAAARPLFVLSLIAVVVQFGYLFLTTDLIAHKGLSTIYFPLFITIVCVFQVWLAGRAQRRRFTQAQ